MAFIKSLAMAATACLALSATLVSAAPSTTPIDKRAPPLKFQFGSTKMRGVNLGGWFVLEPWITPSLFEEFAESKAAVDEYTLTATLGKEEAYRRLSQHWATFITEDDFRQIRAAGFNFVRIPIGYWSVTPLPGDPYVQGAYAHFAQALNWAQKYGLKVLTDIHGAPGSQNGFDNSGHKGAILWTTGDTVAQTKAALTKLRNDFANHPAVAVMQLINEPMGPKLDINTISQYYYDGWGILSQSPVAISFHDAFQDLNYWDGWGAGTYSLIEDTHHYEVFDPNQLVLSPSGHVGSACAYGAKMASSPKWVISGEWSGAMTDCAHWLNGLGIGARYDGTYFDQGTGSSYIGPCTGFTSGSVSQLSAEQRVEMRQFIEAQLDGYETAAGWIFWTWKTQQGAPGWDMQDLLANGVFPQPIDARQYPGQCG